MPKVIQRDKEYFDRMLARFRKQVEKAGIIQEIRKREFYEKPCDARNRKKNAAIRRGQKLLMKSRSMANRGRLRNVR